MPVAGVAGLAKLLDGTIKLPRKNPQMAISPQARLQHRPDALKK
jgi:hypothetical protein